MKTSARIGQKYANNLPMAVGRAAGGTDGEKVSLEVVGNTVTIEILKDPLELAISGKKFASLKPLDVERISASEQKTDV
jgi:hypothetical protein